MKLPNVSIPLDYAYFLMREVREQIFIEKEAIAACQSLLEKGHRDTAECIRTRKERLENLTEVYEYLKNKIAH